MDISTAELSVPNSYQSSKRHSDVSTDDLSNEWFISFAQTTKTKNTTQNYSISALLPLFRRYRVNHVYFNKTLTGEWSTDTIDDRTKSLDGDRYAQVYANKGYFAKIYPMDSRP